jgi:hypothetical protein
MKKLCIILCLLLAGTAWGNNLLQNTTPAERMRGASFGEHFRSQASVEAYNGSVTGSPTFDIEDGVTLDGSADYITYNLMGGEFNSDPITIVIEFTPDFATNENVVRFLCDSTAGKQYRINKLANVDNNTIRIFLGNTQIADIAEATYSPYWTVGSRHVMVISGTSGDTDAWLNGNAILTNDATAWTADDPTEFYVGARNDGNFEFDGTIHSVKVFKAQLTAAEAQDYYDHSTYKYMDSATAVYQMRAEDHDPTNNRTLDSSGNGYHATDTSDPVKLATVGYEFDAINDFFSRTHFNPSADFTVVCLVNSDNSGRFAYIASEWNAGTNQRGWILEHHSSAFWQVGLSKSGLGGGDATWETVGTVQSGRPTFVAMSYDYVTDGTSLIDFWADDLVANTTNAVGPCHASTVDFYIGTDDAAGGRWDGDIYLLYVIDAALTTLQIKDAQMQAWKGLQRI